jgi:MFS family permease
MMTQTSQSIPASPLAPFRHRAFFWLWLGVVVGSVGTWAQMVGAQWLFVNDPNAATIVTLVQTASTLPMMLLALPAGVLADAFDRRWLMFGVQIYFVGVAVLLAVLTAAGMMPPALLLTFTFAVGAGQAMLSPTWQALITEIVPPERTGGRHPARHGQRKCRSRSWPALAGFEDAAFSHIVGAPRTQHLLPPETPRNSLSPHAQESGANLAAQ